MRKAFVFRIKPVKQQTQALEEMLDAHRLLYNCALQHRRDSYRQRGISVSFAQQSADVKFIRREIVGFDTLNASSLILTLRRLDRAFAAFFRRLKAGEQPGYPRFRGRGRHNSVDFKAGDGAHFRARTVTIQGVGDMPVIQHRPVEGLIKQISVKRLADGWYVVLACDVAEPEVPCSPLPPVGIDLGLKAFIAMSTGEIIAAPQHFRQVEQRLRRAQRALARCKRGSNRRKKAKQRVALLYLNVRRARDDFQSKTIAGLLRHHGAFAVEDLNVQGLARSRLAKSVHDAAWGSFLAKLTFKAASAGAIVVKVRPHNTSQACSDCGGLADVPIKLGTRTYRCSHCGLVLDRDVNAAHNILSISGLLRPVGRERESVDCALSEKLTASVVM